MQIASAEGPAELQITCTLWRCQVAVNMLSRWRALCRLPLQRSLQEIEKLAKEQAGCVFSLGSAQEVANVLFNVLKLPVPPNARPLRGGKLFSTSAEVSHKPISQFIDCV